MRYYATLFLWIVFTQLQAQEITSPTYNNECSVKLDSLANIIKHIRFGVYSVDLDEFSVQHYKGLSEIDLALRGIPLSTEEQRIHEFGKFLHRLFKDEQCASALTGEMLIAKVGKPYEVGYDGSYTYLLNIGKDCPDCQQPINRIFEGCSFIRIRFGKDAHLRNSIFLSY
jgi:hypothetical protein